MRALVYTGPGEMALQDVQPPEAGPESPVVHIAKVGICGSDMHAFLGHDERRPAPLVLGHEAAGITDDGRRVTINPLVTCGQCPACRAGRDNLCPTRQIISMPPRPGAFAEAVAMPERNLVPIPADMPFAKAALAEPLAVCFHAARVGLQALAGTPDRAVVLGGGAIGLGSALALIASGAGEVEIVEPNQTRRDYLSDHGHPAIAELGAEPADIVIDAVGYAATRATASRIVRPGGVIVHVGLGDSDGGLDIRRMTLQEITVIGTYAYTAHDFRTTVGLMAEGRLGALDWTETRPLADGPQAFSDLKAGKVAAPKIILDPETA